MIPERAQSMAALAQANTVRLARADLKRATAKPGEIVRALVEAVEEYERAEDAYRSPTAAIGVGQKLWTAETNLGKALDEAKQWLVPTPPREQEGKK